MREADEEIREIKKEIIESRGLTIKTNNLVSALGADIKSIAKRQAGYERRFTWNSWVVYAIIAALSFAGLKLASDARIGEIGSEVATLEARVQELETDLSEETRRASERAASATKAERFYELIREQRRAQVVSGYPDIAREQLSPAEAAFFQATYRQFRLDLSLSAYREGLQLIGAKRYKDALPKFEKSLELQADAPHAPAVRYEIAAALRKLSRPTEAIVYARQVVEQQKDTSLHPDAWWVIAKGAQAERDLDTARDALKTLIRKWPRSSLAKDARPLLRDLTRQAILGRKSAPAAAPAPASPPAAP